MHALPFTLLTALFALPVHAQEEGAPAEPEATKEDDPEPALKPADSSASAPRTTVEVELSSGIKLTGTILTSDALSWEPGQPLSFTPESETTPSLLEASRIKSVNTQVETAPAEPAEPPPAETSAEPESRGPTVNPGQGRYLSPGMGEAADKGDGILGLSPNLSQMAFAPVNGLELWLGVSGLDVIGTGSTGGISWSRDLGDGITFNSSAIATREGTGENAVLPNGKRGFIRRTASLGFTFSKGAHHASLSGGYGAIASAMTEELTPAGEFYAGVPVRIAAQARLFEGVALVFDRQLFFAPSMQAGPFLQSTALDDIAFTVRVFPKRRPGRWNRTESGDPVHYWDIGFISKSVVRQYSFMGQISEYSPILPGDPAVWISRTVNFAAAKDRRNARRKTRQQKASK